MSECSSDCGSCSSDCGSRTAPQDFSAHLAPGANVKHVYAVMSGKGGVGKSLVTSMLATALAAKGSRVGILDADITGPSIPKSFGVTRDQLLVTGGEEDPEAALLLPPVSSNGIRIMSANLLVENEDDPVLWRGALIASAVKQFYSEVFWDDIDFLLVDMPPGTGDVPLTVFQSLPVEGIIMVTSPQELVSMIVNKAVNMAKQMSIPVIGIVENMSYFECPDNGKRYSVFGESHIDEIAAEKGLNVLAKLPIDPSVAKLVDEGRAAEIDVSPLDNAVKIITGIAGFKPGC
ncbi:MAG: Mrp/NBP35 family ATP-binding protein [Eubacteriales bacterium]|nr:Mrp/NBP35 family ATP-binding protein [Eubacteriales bacterium]